MGIVAGTLRARQMEEALKAGRLDPADVTAAVGKYPRLLLRRRSGSVAHHTLAHAAAAAGNAAVLARLLAEAAALGPSVAAALANARNSRGQTPLMLAAGVPGGTACVRLLLEAGADPWAADLCGGRTPLYYAVGCDAADAAAALLAATSGAGMPGARCGFPNQPGTPYVDARMLLGFTPLHVAVAADARACMRLLIHAGARLSMPTLFTSFDFPTPCPRGTCPIHLAARHNRAEAAKMILLAHVHAPRGAVDPRVLVDELCRLPCQLSADNGHTDLAQLLLPGVPLARALGAQPGDLYLGGTPPLKLLATVALRARQRDTLIAARAALGLGRGTAAAGDGCPGGGGISGTAHVSDVDGGALRAGCGAAAPREHPSAGCPQGVHSAGEACEALAGKAGGWEVQRTGVTPRVADAPDGAGTGFGACAARAGCSFTTEPGSTAGAPPAPRCCAAPPTDDEDACGVCLDAAPSIVLRPCGHALCAGCCRGLFGMRHAEVVACPFCRSLVGTFEVAAAPRA